MNLIEKHSSFSPSQMAEVVISNEDYSGKFSAHFVHSISVPYGHDYNIRDMIMQIISFDNCKGVVRNRDGIGAKTIIRRIEYGITMDNLEKLKSDFEKECPNGFYLRAVDLLVSPGTTKDTEFRQAPHVKITMVEHSDLAVDYPKTLDEAWSMMLEQVERIDNLEALVSELSAELQLEKNGCIAIHGEDVEEGLMDILTEEILKDDE